MKEFYDHRCKIVHGKPFRENPSLVGEAEAMLATGIKRIVRSQRIPDWRKEVKAGKRAPANLG